MLECCSIIEQHFLLQARESRYGISEMKFSPLITQLIEGLTCLPGVGPKSAQRMAFHLLERNRRAGDELAVALHQAMSDVKHCAMCRTFTEDELCHICQNPKRSQNGQLCIVETPADVVAMEQTGHFYGRFFVLMGHLSPLDGIGPSEIGLDKLEVLLQQMPISEVILATNPTVEGEATAHYIADICQQYEIKASRIAHGVPVGTELEYVDGTTLSHSFNGRITL